jgi:uncharacterized membrane protein YtjA (UPF0391 family)
MSYAAFLFVIAILAVVLGYATIAAALAGLAKLLFVLGSAARLQAARPAVCERL